MIQEVIKGIDETPDLDTKIKTIENIRSVTEGKIYVEVERARVSRTLSKIKEDEGDIDAATEILGELQVETYGSMDIREKTEFILEQVELYIKKVITLVLLFWAVKLLLDILRKRKLMI